MLKSKVLEEHIVIILGCTLYTRCKHSCNLQCCAFAEPYQRSVGYQSQIVLLAWPKATSHHSRYANSPVF